jgi:hypothetical protein
MVWIEPSGGLCPADEPIRKRCYGSRMGIIASASPFRPSAQDPFARDRERTPLQLIGRVWGRLEKRLQKIGNGYSKSSSVPTRSGVLKSRCATGSSNDSRMACDRYAGWPRLREIRRFSIGVNNHRSRPHAHQAPCKIWISLNPFESGSDVETPAQGKVGHFVILTINCEHHIEQRALFA